MLRHTTLLMAACMLLLSAQAHAGENAAPYFEIFGGYLNTDAQGVQSVGTNAAGFTVPADTERFMTTDDAFFAGLAVGTPLREGPFNFLRVYAEGVFFNDGSDFVDIATTPGVGTIILPAPSDATFAADPGPTGSATSSLERNRYELGASFGFAQRSFPLALAVQPFAGWGTEDSQTVLSDGGARNGDMDWGYGGVMLSATHRMPVSQNVAFIARAAGGIYYYDADGNYQQLVVGPEVFATSADGFGFRGQLELSLETTLSSNVVATVFGGLDYWSAYPVTEYPDPMLLAGIDPTVISDEDALEFRAGAKLRVLLQ